MAKKVLAWYQKPPIGQKKRQESIDDSARWRKNGRGSGRSMRRFSSLCSDNRRLCVVPGRNQYCRRCGAEKKWFLVRRVYYLQLLCCERRARSAELAACFPIQFPAGKRKTKSSGFIICCERRTWLKISRARLLRFPIPNRPPSQDKVKSLNGGAGWEVQ